MGLSKEQIARYSRQLMVPEIGVRGQERLLNASVLVVGVGGLGCPSALYLSAAGVGTIGLLDRELVESSNLHRQVLYTQDDIGRPKSLCAQQRLAGLNPGVKIHAIQESLTTDNARRLLKPYDVIIDGSDNFPTRYLANDACILLGKPLIHAGVVHLRGQLMTILPRRSACLRCVFPEPPVSGTIPSCQEAGVLGAAAGVLGTLTAHETLKVLLGLDELLTGRLLIFEGSKTQFREVRVRRDPACAVCGERPTIQELRSIAALECGGLIAVNRTSSDDDGVRPRQYAGHS